MLLARFTMYLKFKATHIFDGSKLLPKHKVLITTTKGVVEAIVDEEFAGSDVQQFEGIICPGFINAHCHLELSFLKNKIPQHTGMVGFIEYILQKRNEINEIIEDSIANAEKEMIDNGIVAVGDICNTAYTLQQKLKGNLYYHNFIELSGFVPQTAPQRFAAGIEVYNQFTEHFAHNTSLVPHAPYSISKALIQLIDEYQHNYIASIHSQESIDETLFFTQKQGAFLQLYKNLGIDISFFNEEYNSSIEQYLPILKNAVKTILVHNTFTQKTDVDLIKCSSTIQFYYCICVIANSYITNCVPNIELFNANDIVIGTDSLASNTELNVLKELQTMHNFYKNIGIEKLLQMATSNGAKALGIDSWCGSFEKGKQPKVLLIDNFFEAKKPTVLI